MACHRDIGHLLVVPSDESSLVLLEGAILEFPVEYPTDFDAGHVWYYLTDVVGLESPPCPLLHPSIISRTLRNQAVLRVGDPLRTR